MAADTVYGVSDVEMALGRAGKGYVLGVKTDHLFNSWIGKPPVAGTAEAIANGLAPTTWTRLSAGDGTKGARLYDWAYCELADLDGADDQTGLWTRGLLIRRSLADGERAYFTTWCPAGTPIQTLVGVEGRRWSIEDAFETAKTELRARSQRDPLLVRLAPTRQPGDDGLRPAGGDPPSRQRTAPKKTGSDETTRPLIRWSVQEIRRIAVRLAQRRIQPAHVIAWSLWRRAHQAAAGRAHLKRRASDPKRRRQGPKPRTATQQTPHIKKQL